MGLIFKALVFLIVVAFVALVGFAYLGDLRPEQSEVTQPVILNVN